MQNAKLCARQINVVQPLYVMTSVTRLHHHALCGHARVWSDCANCHHVNLSLDKAYVRQRLLQTDVEAVSHV